MVTKSDRGQLELFVATPAAVSQAMNETFQKGVRSFLYRSNLLGHFVPKISKKKAQLNKE